MGGLRVSGLGVFLVIVRYVHAIPGAAGLGLGPHVAKQPHVAAYADQKMIALGVKPGPDGKPDEISIAQEQCVGRKGGDHLHRMLLLGGSDFRIGVHGGPAILSGQTDHRLGRRFFYGIVPSVHGVALRGGTG